MNEPVRCDAYVPESDGRVVYQCPMNALYVLSERRKLCAEHAQLAREWAERKMEGTGV